MNQDFLHELKKRFTGDLRFDSASRILYSTDASMYQIEPLGVAIPRTQDDLQAAVELAAKYKVPILPRGAGSSLAGQAIGEALILDCSRHLDSIIGIDPDSQSAVVEPGVVLSTLNAACARFGLMFGPDPASAERATMGGVIGNNATGAHSILYGMSADHLISADVILADGSLETWDESGRSKLFQTALSIREKYSKVIKQKFSKSWRNSAGYRINYLLPYSPSQPPQWTNPQNRWSVYESRNTKYAINLAPLLAGSEGTLAIMRRAKINLVSKPKCTILGVLAYDSIVAACEDAPRLLEFNPSAIELIPQLIIHLARGASVYAREMGWLAGDPAAVLVIEFSGDDPQKIKEDVKKIGDVLTIAESKEDQARIWNIRKMGLGILDSRPLSARPAAFIEDCAVPVEQLGAFVREVERILRAHHAEGGIYAHASGGCLHIRPILDLHRGEGVRALRSIGEKVLALTLSLGGAMSSEHGDGIVRGEWIEKTYGAELTEAMRSLKRAADPDGILNPKKMFDAPPMDTHLRYGESYRVQTWPSALPFNHEAGLAGAIEHCNGQGVCRKTTGTMCPSFQATREESNSTRGRANLLRSLIASHEPRSTKRELAQSTFAALDLCLACKGCTSECPSSVDMPKLKYEFMNEYFKTHRRPLRDYLFGYFHVVSKWIVPVAPLANLFMRMNWSRRLIARAMGITEKRPFPIYAGKQAGRYTSKQITNNDKKVVIFLSDVFARYLEPEVEQAAFDILHAAGYEVKIMPVIGAGASLLSKGFISAARAHAEKTLDAIKSLDAGSNLLVVGCEPPEVYCLKHEYTSLMPHRRAEIEAISKRVWLMDEFLLRNIELDKLISTAPRKSKIVFHPHCHQRAEGLADDGLPSGTSATVSMLHACGFDVEVMDTGCCGMAGTFGYDAEHYDLSMQVGELKLFPNLREVDDSKTPIVSTGSACRLQIKQGTQKTAEHPLVLIASLLPRRKGIRRD